MPTFFGAARDLLLGTKNKLSITPRTVNVVWSHTQQFTARGGKKPISWTVPVGSGTVNGSGLYTAPAAGTGTETVRATDQDGRTVDATVTLNSNLSISPNYNPTYVLKSTTRQFTAAAGTAPYTYGSTGVGSVNGTGLYTAPGSPGAASVTATDATSTVVSSPIQVTTWTDRCISLDGVTQYLDASASTFNPTNTDSFTLLATANVTNTNGNSIFGKIEDLGGGNPRGFTFQVQQQSGALAISLYLLHDYNANQLIQVETQNTFSKGTRLQIAAAYNGSGLASGVKIWVNGQAQALTVIHDNLTGTIQNVGGLRLGSVPIFGNFLAGTLVAAQTFPGYVFTDADAAAHFSATDLPDPTTLSTYSHCQNYWPLGQGDTAPNFADLKSGQGATGVNGPSIVVGELP